MRSWLPPTSYDFTHIGDVKLAIRTTEDAMIKQIEMLEAVICGIATKLTSEKSKKWAKQRFEQTL